MVKWVSAHQCMACLQIFKFYAVVHSELMLKTTRNLPLALENPDSRSFFIFLIRWKCNRFLNCSYFLWTFWCIIHHEQIQYICTKPGQQVSENRYNFWKSFSFFLPFTFFNLVFEHRSKHGSANNSSLLNFFNLMVASKLTTFPFDHT